MNIDKLEVYYVAMPLIQPWRTAYGADYDIHSVLTKAYSGDSYAWSESTPFYAPTYLNESAGSVFYHVSEIFGPHIVGKNYKSPEDMDRELSIFKGNSFAKAAIEICYWTLQSKITSEPLHRLLGGESKEVIPGADFGILDTFDELIQNIQIAVDKGFPRVKLKAAPGWDLEMLKAVRSTFPDITLHIDCNSGYTLDDLSLFKEIDKLNLAFIEQPLHWNDIVDHAALAREIETPICLDETIHSVKAAEQALEINACQYINIKPGRVGGLFNSKQIHDMAKNQGVPVWVGGMLESALGGAICIELATLSNFTYPGDLFPSSRFYVQDLCDPSNELTDRNTFLPFANGLPEPNPDRLVSQTIRKSEVLPKD
tara:strand:- start:12616 stop:13725 length:1110 start_codon:yes stop_codon:yes gene_type:complete